MARGAGDRQATGARSRIVARKGDDDAFREFAKTAMRFFEAVLSRLEPDQDPVPILIIEGTNGLEAIEMPPVVDAGINAWINEIAIPACLVATRASRAALASLTWIEDPDEEGDRGEGALLIVADHEKSIATRGGVERSLDQPPRAVCWSVAEEPPSGPLFEALGGTLYTLGNRSEELPSVLEARAAEVYGHLKAGDYEALGL
jgi:hypothetical protein